VTTRTGLAHTERMQEWAARRELPVVNEAQVEKPAK